MDRGQAGLAAGIGVAQSLHPAVPATIRVYRAARLRSYVDLPVIPPVAGP